MHALNTQTGTHHSPCPFFYPNYETPFVLNTDASFTGLGVILMQNYEGKNAQLLLHPAF